MTAPTWLLDVLDRVLPELTGGERDRIAIEIVDAAPPEIHRVLMKHDARAELEPAPLPPPPSAIAASGDQR